MEITEGIFLNYLLCPYKAYRLLKGESGRISDYETLQKELNGVYVHKVLGNGQNYDHLPKGSFQAKGLMGRELAQDVQIRHADVSTLCVGMMKNFSESTRGMFYYSPVTFSHKDKILKSDRYVLAFRAWILEKIQDRRIDFGDVIYGDTCKRSKVKLAKHVNEIGRIVGQLRGCVANPPPFLLNEHCQICEFQETCREKAIKEEHLGLLGAMSAKEVVKKNKKGIFTLTQLSYTFRPRRKRKAPENYKRPHSVALRALAIRDKKVCVHGTPVIPRKPVEIFFDIEGREGGAFIYLVSLIVAKEEKIEQHSFWANGPEDEADIFFKCLRVLQGYDDYVLFHYGSYEISYLKRMKRKQKSFEDAIDAILSKSFNILEIFFDCVYMPTYTNGLKDIARYLGFQWSDHNASGLQSIVWRSRWEMTGAEEHREKLIRYNLEDCYALLKVKQFLECLIEKESSDKRSDVVYVDDLKKKSIFKFCTGEFALPEFEALNKCAQFDYQRERVHVRTNSYLKKYYAKSAPSPRRRYIHIGEPNISLPAPKKEPCPLCNKNTRKTLSSLSKKVVDLRFSKSGVRRWIVQYLSNLFYCSRCKKSFVPIWYKSIDKKYGHDLMSWTMYQHIVKGQSFRQVASDFHEIFGLSVEKSNVHTFKSYIMEYYRETFESIGRKILNSPVLYVDETPIIMKYESGYAWVLTNTVETISFYRPTREGDFIKEYLANFRGILVTDFYNAYDALSCLQQKCLLHLMRDFNDDLLKSPFDDEFKGMARDFTVLLQEIVGEIDKRGLKKRHLRKYAVKAERFLKNVTLKDYGSEMARQYQKRFIKNQGKLFLFLNHDNVAWNNNAVEHAIKLLATHKNKNLAFFRESRMDEYLKIMSIYQTCKYKGISFLKFMLSKEKDIDVYCERFMKRRKIAPMLG